MLITASKLMKNDTFEYNGHMYKVEKIETNNEIIDIYYNDGSYPMGFYPKSKVEVHLTENEQMVKGALERAEQMYFYGAEVSVPVYGERVSAHGNRYFPLERRRYSSFSTAWKAFRSRKFRIYAGDVEIRPHLIGPWRENGHFMAPYSR